MGDVGGVPLPPGYVLVERLGSGGFATVWLAEQGRLGRRVAVKVLGEMLEDSERERRFLAECQAIGRLSGHPAVVTVHDAGTTESGHPYLVMEHLPGGSLHDRVARQGPLPWAEVLAVGVSVADALAAAHDAGILHRDVKPANVLLDENGAPKLGDFGIARLAEGTNTATGTLVGTIQFTPPEVLSGQRPGPTADIWALGATMHALLAGSSPFGGDRDEPPAATIARVLRSEPSPLPPAVPEPLRALIGQMLAADPAARPATSTEVVRHLQHIQADRGLPVTAARSNRSEPAPPPPEATATVVGLAPAVASPPGPFPASPASVGATTVLPGADGQASVPAPPPPGSTPPGGTPLPSWAPPPGSPPTPPRSRRGVLVVVVVVLVLVAAGVGAALALGGGDGDGSEEDPVAAGSSAPAPTRDQEEDDAAVVDTRWGAPLAVPTGSAEEPTEGWDVDGVACPGAGTCPVAEYDGDLLVLAEEGGMLTLTRHAADDGEDVFSLEVGPAGESPGLARAGDLPVVVTTLDGLRTYHGIEPDGSGVRWSVAVDAEASPVLSFPQASADHAVIVLGATQAYVSVALADGAEVPGEGRVLATDADTIYVAVDDTVVARELATGDERWSVPDLPSAAPEGLPPARFAAVQDDVLVMVTADDVIGLDREGGDEAWREPLSEDGSLGRPIMVSTANGRVVVLAETGDLGIDADGTVAWRHTRPRLTADPTLDEEVVRSVRGHGIWFAADESLLVGWTGIRLQVLDTGTGDLSRDDALPATDGRSAISPFAGTLALLDGTGVTAYPIGDADPLWTVDAGDATAMVAIDGGIALSGPSGVRTLLGG